MPKNENTSLVWMTPDQVRVYLGEVSESTLARYRELGLPVHYITARTPRYNRAEVDEWVRQRGEQTRAET